MSIVRDVTLPDDIHKVEHITTFDTHTHEIFQVRFSPDGTTLLSTDEQVINAWVLSVTGNWSYQNTLRTGALFPRFSPDGNVLVFYDQEHHLQVWSKEWQHLATMNTEGLKMTGGAFSPDGTWFVTGDRNGSIQLWNMTTYMLQTVALPIPTSERNKTGPYWSQFFSFTPDGTQIAFTSPGTQGYVHVCSFDPISLHIKRTHTFPHTVVSDLQFAPNGKLLAVSDFSHHCVHLYDTTSLQHHISLPMEHHSGQLAFSPDSRFLASARDDGSIMIWSLQTYTCITSFAAHPGLQTEQENAIGGLDWSSQGDFIATGGASFFQDDVSHNDYTIKIWRVIYNTPSA